MRFMEASTFLKKAQSAVFFMAISKARLLEGDGSLKSSLSESYLLKIEEISSGTANASSTTDS